MRSRVDVIRQRSMSHVDAPQNPVESSACASCDHGGRMEAAGLSDRTAGVSAGPLLIRCRDGGDARSSLLVHLSPPLACRRLGGHGRRPVGGRPAGCNRNSSGGSNQFEWPPVAAERAAARDSVSKEEKTENEVAQHRETCQTKTNATLMCNKLVCIDCSCLWGICVNIHGAGRQNVL